MRFIIKLLVTPFRNNSARFALILLILFFMSFSQSLLSAEIEHSYDSLNRLVKTVSIDGSKTSTIEYSYDDTGNMTSVTTTVEGGVDLVSFVAQFGQSDCAGCESDLHGGDGDVDGQDIIAFFQQ